MTNEPISAKEGALLGGWVRFRQSVAGYRAGMDAALLAAACDAKPGDRIADVGCGAGAVMLAAAARVPEATFVGLERDPNALVLARENIALNDFGNRMNALSADVSAPWKSLGLAPFDHVLCNPPFFDDANALRGPSSAKAAAWIADAGLEAWIAFLVKAAREGGKITLIHRADRLGDILRLFAPKVGSIRVRPVYPSTNAPAKRVIVRGVKTGKAPLKLLPAFTLHTPENNHTPEADAIFHGASLPWT